MAISCDSCKNFFRQLLFFFECDSVVYFNEVKKKFDTGFLKKKKKMNIDIEGVNFFLSAM